MVKRRPHLPTLTPRRSAFLTFYLKDYKSLTPYKIGGQSANFLTPLGQLPPKKIR
jgi:hypothetical protein